MPKEKPGGGFTQIPHWVLEVLACLRLTPRQWQVVVYILRMTYGYHKKMKRIPQSWIARATGLARTNVSCVIKELLVKLIVIRSDNKRIGLNEDYLQKLSVLITSQKLSIPITKGINIDNKMLSELTSFKNSKDNGKIVSAEEETSLRDVYSSSASEVVSITVRNEEDMGRIQELTDWEIEIGGKSIYSEEFWDNTLKELKYFLDPQDYTLLSQHSIGIGFRNGSICVGVQPSAISIFIQKRGLIEAILAEATGTPLKTEVVNWELEE